MRRRKTCAYGALLIVAMPSLAMVQEPGAAPSSGESANNRPARASTGLSNPADDVKAIRASAQDFVAAFNRGDAKGVAALWTQDGDCIDESGKKSQGRAEIEKAYAEVFRANPGCQIRVAVDSLRLLSPEAAIEDGHATLDPEPMGAPAISKYTAVHIKVGDKWLMSTVRESRVETPSGYAKVADLDWLIGTWSAEERGAKTVSVYRWVANKSFVERTYTVTNPDHTTTSGVQLIGFNPSANCIQSWNFSPDGGHAIGHWTPRDKGWSAELRGVTGEGTLTTAVNLLTKLDDDAYVWQSIRRTAGGAPLPDTGEVILKRGKSAR